MGMKLKLIRLAKGISQGYVAKMLGITQTTLSRKENGKSKFTADELIELCVLYNIDVRELAE